jgi:tetratricopeptide (TPR) repeat protein
VPNSRSMALKISTQSFTAPTPPATPEEWRGRVQDTYAQGSAAVAAGDPAALAVLFGEVAGWDDPQRAFQARQALAEVAMSAPQSRDGWVRLYLAAAAGIVDALAGDPCEPVLLNYAGVLLYELNELAGAEELFRAARRLDPALPHVERNLAAVRLRKRAHAAARLHPSLAAEVKRLGARAKRIAAAARPAKGLTLSLCMIVKDEEEMLPGCLEAVRDVVDEIVVVDTGSSDGTVEIARSFGARIVEFPWNGSFADARNVSLEHATGDWILQLDADEHIVAEDAPRLRELIGRTWREAFYLVETHFTSEDSGPAMTNSPLRLWRNRPAYRFEGRIHEQKTHTMPTFLPNRFEHTTVRMLHYGYMRSIVAAKDKSRRNIELLEIEARETPSAFNAYNLGSEYLALGEPEQARTYLQGGWDAVRQEDAWEGAGYTPLLATRLARACREARDFAAARRVIDEGLAAFPDHTDLVMESALCARDEGDHEAAGRLAERCLAMGDAPARYAATVGSGTYLALNLLAQTRSRLGRPEEAEELHVRSLAEHPAYTAPILPLVASRLGRELDVDAVLTGVPATGPSAMLLVATALYEAGHAAVAETWFARVLERQPGNGAARIGLVESLLSQRRYRDAAAEAAREEAGSPVAHAAAGAELFALAAAGDGAAVLARRERAIECGLSRADVELYGAWAGVLSGRPAPVYLPPDAVTTAATALEALLRVEDVDAFVTLLQLWEAIAVDPRDRAEILAWIYFRRGFLESAADEWIAVMETRPDPHALMGLAHVAVAREMPSEAAELAAEAVALDPMSGDARALHEAILARYANLA